VSQAKISRKSKKNQRSIKDLHAKFSKQYEKSPVKFRSKSIIDGLGLLGMMINENKNMRSDIPGAVVLIKSEKKGGVNNICLTELNFDKNNFKSEKDFKDMKQIEFTYNSSNKEIKITLCYIESEGGVSEIDINKNPESEDDISAGLLEWVFNLISSKHSFKNDIQNYYE